MHLFLEGNVGIGKTTMILQELHRLSLKAAGFVSVRLVRCRMSAGCPPVWSASTAPRYHRNKFS